MTRCDSDAVEGGRYHYVLVVPGYGEMAWHGVYTGVDSPGRLDANEWFVMGTAEPTGELTAQTLTFEPAGDGFTLMTMHVDLPEPEDPETFMEQSAADLSSSLATMDVLVSTREAIQRLGRPVTHHRQGLTALLPHHRRHVGCRCGH